MIEAIHGYDEAELFKWMQWFYYDVTEEVLFFNISLSKRFFSQFGFINANHFDDSNSWLLDPSLALIEFEGIKHTHILNFLQERVSQLAIREFNPKNPNIYRGIFPLIHGKLSHKEGYDMGDDFEGESALEKQVCGFGYSVV